MSISVFSFLMAILWFSLFVVISAVLRSFNGFMLQYRMIPLLLLLTLAVFRLFCSFELPISLEISSYTLLPAINNFITKEIFSLSNGLVIYVYRALIVGWLVVSLILLTFLVYKYISFYRSTSHLPEIHDPRIDKTLEKVIKTYGKKVSVIKAPIGSVPMITGIFRAIVLLPGYDMSDDDLERVLKHEWIHFLHKDNLIKLLINVLCCIFWWNPFIYLLRHNIDHALEINCDMSIIGQMSENERLEYLGCIVRALKKTKSDLRRIPVAAAGLVSTANDKLLKQRFSVLLEFDKKKRASKFSTALLSILMITTFAFSFLFIFQSAYISPEYEDGFSIYDITAENAYLIKNDRKTYSLYIDGKYVVDIDLISTEPYSSLPIK